MVASGPSSNYDEADFNHGLLGDSWLVSALRPRPIFVDIFDAFFVDKEVCVSVTGQSDHVPVVVFDPSPHFFIVHKLYDDWNLVLRQPVEIFPTRGFAR